MNPDVNYQFSKDPLNGECFYLKASADPPYSFRETSSCTREKAFICQWQSKALLCSVEKQ